MAILDGVVYSYPWGDIRTGNYDTEGEVIVIDAMRRVEVSWYDATSFSNEWLSLEEIRKLEPDGYITVGFLIDEREDAIILAQSKGKGEFYNIFQIPRGCVIEIRELHD